ncbi:MAG: hypothetical protein ABI327_17480 [Burkholderiaceae bacterium]
MIRQSDKGPSFIGLRPRTITAFSDVARRRSFVPLRPAHRILRTAVRSLAASHDGSVPPFIELEHHMNNIVWLVGAVVIVLAILGFFGLR